MDIRYCRRCNLLYKNGNGGLCAACIKELEDIMLKVRRYLEENPQAGVTEVSEGVQESEKDILFLLREGRLSIRSEGHHCSRCGKPIESERYCTNCIKEIKMQLKGVVNDFKDNTDKYGNNGYAPKDNSTISKKGEMFTFKRRKDYM